MRTISDDAGAVEVLRLCQSAVQYRLRGYDRISFLTPEDLAHEVFLKFMMRCRIQPDAVRATAASTLIYRMANDVVIDQLRRSHHEAGTDALSEIEDPARPGTLALDECQFWIARLRRVLAAGDRDVLNWFVANARSVNDTMDRKEAAARLGLSEGAVRAAVGRIVESGHALPSCGFDSRFVWFRKRPSFKNSQALLAYVESDVERAVAHAAACVYYHQGGVNLGSPSREHCEAVLHHAEEVLALCGLLGIDPSERSRARWPAFLHIVDQLFRWSTYSLDTEQWHLVFGHSNGSRLDCPAMLGLPFECWVGPPDGPVPAPDFDRQDLF